MKIAIVGATGLVGQNIIKLCKQFFSNDVEYTFFASANSAGKIININSTDVKVLELKLENIQSYDIADRKSTRLNSSHSQQSRMPSSA